MMRLIKIFTPLVAGLSMLSTPALAQTVPEHGVFVLNSLLFLIGGFLVMFMACGFCMLEAGLVRAKNTTTQLTKNIALFSIASRCGGSSPLDYMRRRRPRTLPGYGARPTTTCRASAR